MFGALGNKTDVIEELIRHGADLNLVNDSQHTAVNAASWSGSTQVLELLCAHGGPTDVFDSDFKRTALMWAVYCNHPSNVNVLLKHGASLDYRDSEGCTAMDMASEEGYTDIVELLEEEAKRRCKKWLFVLPRM